VRYRVCLIACVCAAGCAPTVIERLDPALDALVDPAARLETLATGHQWTEGPVWVKAHGFLLYSDVPRNQVWRWSPAGGKTLYLEPSG